MKLVIAGPNAEGRSCVLSSQELPGDRVINVWNGDCTDTVRNIEALAPGAAAAKVEPAAGPGGVRWVLNRVPPEREAADWGYTPMGPHITRTIDFDYVVEGTILCLLDEETVELNTGDFIVLQAARHAWRNPTDAWAVKLALLHFPHGSTTDINTDETAEVPR